MTAIPWLGLGACLRLFFELLCFEAMNDWSGCEALEREPGKVSGGWVFRDTRVPALALFENLEDGVMVAEFVELFPGVTTQQVRTVLAYVAIGFV